MSTEKGGNLFAAASYQIFFCDLGKLTRQWLALDIHYYIPCAENQLTINPTSVGAIHCQNCSYLHYFFLLWDYSVECTMCSTFGHGNKISDFSDNFGILNHVGGWLSFMSGDHSIVWLFFNKWH